MAESIVLSCRVSPKVNDALKAQADKNGESLSKYVSRLLEKNFDPDSSKSKERARLQALIDSRKNPKPNEPNDSSPDPSLAAECEHPGDKHKQTGYGTLCGVCGTKVA